MHNYGATVYPKLGGCTMKELKILETALDSHLTMNAARLCCFAGIIIALLKVRTVNFTQLAVGFPGKAKKDSKYRRIQRFFESVSFDYTLILVWQLLALHR